MNTVRSLFTGLLLLCTVYESKPAEEKPGAPPPGRAQETWQFWEAFNKASISGVGGEVLRQEAWQEGVETKDTCLVLEDVISGEQARSRAMTALPVLHVDPDLTAYAIEFAKVKMELASALEDYALLVKKQDEMTSMPVLGAGLLMSLMNHSDDKEDGILWRAMLDEGKQTAADLQTLKEPAQKIEARAAGVRKLLSRLGTDEMALRVKLAQRFNREFPPRESYLKAAGAGHSAKQLGEKEIMQSLIGQKVQGPAGRWTFDSPDEFVSLKVMSITNQTDLLTDYFVQTHVKGISSGQEHDFKLRVSYGRLYTRWKFVGVNLVP